MLTMTFAIEMLGCFPSEHLSIFIFWHSIFFIIVYQNNWQNRPSCPPNNLCLLVGIILYLKVPPLLWQGTSIPFCNGHSVWPFPCFLSSIFSLESILPKLFVPLSTTVCVQRNSCVWSFSVVHTANSLAEFLQRLAHCFKFSGYQITTVLSFLSWITFSQLGFLLLENTAVYLIHKSPSMILL